MWVQKSERADEAAWLLLNALDEKYELPRWWKAIWLFLWPIPFAQREAPQQIENSFGFRILIIFCNMVFGLDWNLKNLNHFSGVWKRLKVTVWGPLSWSRFASATLNQDKESIYCALVSPQWQQSLRSHSVQAGDTWSLKCSIARVDSQNSTFAQAWSPLKQKCSFLCVQTHWVCLSGTQRYCENDSDLSLESLTRTRVESPFSQQDSSRFQVTKIVTRVEASHWLESRYH